MATIFRYRRGATIIVALEAVGATDDDIASITAVSAALKPADGLNVPAATVATSATFSVTTRAGTPEVGPGWDLTIPAAVSAGLVPGNYATNAVLTLAGGAIEVTDALIIELEPSTS